MIHGSGAKRTFVRRPSGWIFAAERQGRLRPPRREVGLALFGVRGYFNMLNEFLVFDLSLDIWSIRTNQLRGKDMGTRRRGISRSLPDVSD